MAMQRIGILGGTFDPPHDAHVALARCAVQALQLDRLKVMPTGQPWHRASPASAALDRVAMCRLAFSDLPGVEVDERETHRGGATYTLDTLLELKRELPQAQWHVIIGADQARQFQNWHRWEELLCLAHWAVADRDPEAGQWQNTAMSKAIRLPFTPLELSATALRSRLTQGLPVSGLDPKVLAYIQHHQLYRSEPT
jgi:nicotinate-nucleotide adenylyltransferase